MIYEELWTDELLDEPYAAELKEKIEDTIERKDLDQLTEIIRNIEIAVGEDIIEEGPLGVVYNIQDAIGETQTCREFVKLFKKHGLKSQAFAQAADFNELYEILLSSSDDTRDFDRFTKALLEFLFDHPDESMLSSEHKDLFAKALLTFIDNECGSHLFEDIFEGNVEE